MTEYQMPTWIRLASATASAIASATTESLLFQADVSSLHSELWLRATLVGERMSGISISVIFTRRWLNGVNGAVEGLNASLVPIHLQLIAVLSRA